ncbi:MAG: hypothetical protein ACE14V_07690 [bacterium]
MTWKQIEPELYYHANFDSKLTEHDFSKMKEDIIHHTKIAFSDLYKGEFDFEIIIEHGSIKIKIITTIAAVYIFLSQYGSVRSGIHYFYSDLRYAFSKIIKYIDDYHISKHPICVQKRIGVIGRIDQTINDCINRKITQQDCIKKLTELFEIINNSPDKKEIIESLVKYTDLKYDGFFPWNDLKNKLDAMEMILPPRRKEDEVEKEI